MEGIIAIMGQGLMKEVRAHPYTTLAATAALVGLIMYVVANRSLPLEVSALAMRQEQYSGELKRIDMTLTSFKTLSEYTSMDHELRRLEQTLFDLKTAINDRQKNGRPADALYFSRLQEVQSDHDSQERRIKELLRAHPELASADPG